MLQIITKRGHVNVPSFGNRLKKLRRDKNLSQAALGGILGVVQSTIGMYESGQREPDSETLIKIAEFFEVTVDYLIGRDAPTVSIVTSDMPLDPPGWGDLDEEQKQRVKSLTRRFEETIISDILKDRREKGER